MASSILLVEDDLYLSQGLTELLQKSGYVSCRAWNLSQARQSVYSRNFDLLILDVTLPDGDGISFCRELWQGGAPRPFSSSLPGTRNSTLSPDWTPGATTM